MNVGSTIKRIRESQKVTLDDLASRTELSKGYLSLVENDRREPSMSSLQTICHSLDVPIEVVVLLAAKGSSIDEVSIESVEKLKSLLLELVIPDEM